MAIYLELTREFNAGRTRAILSSGQAVVMHGLALMSKDGDWILRETAVDLNHILSVLSDHGARYRFGAPLDARWLSGGWSGHFEFVEAGLRVRTDFVTRPPRLTSTDLSALWAEQDGRDIPVLDVRRLMRIKMTNREKDYPVIGELARLMDTPSERLLYSRSARDILSIAEGNPDLIRRLSDQRPVLRHAEFGRDALERAIDEERRDLMRENEERIQRYVDAASDWAEAWPALRREIESLTLAAAHQVVVDRALLYLPERIP